MNAFGDGPQWTQRHSLSVYRLSELAQLDLFDIADYTFETWGEEQTYRYIGDLEACLKRLAHSPGLGRPCEDIRSGYRRLEHQKHVIFYRVDGEGVFIIRILHQRMLPRLHSLEGPRPG